MCEQQMSIRNFNTEHGSEKYAHDLTFGYNCGFCWHGKANGLGVGSEICLNQNRGVQPNGKREALPAIPTEFRSDHPSTESSYFTTISTLSVIQFVLPFDRGKVECDNLL